APSSTHRSSRCSPGCTRRGGSTCTSGPPPPARSARSCADGDPLAFSARDPCAGGVGDMAKLGFCGLGRMGEPMAARLVDAGHGVTVWNRTPGRAEPLVQRGAREAGTPADAADGAEGVVTVLADPDALRDVVFGADGVASALSTGSTLIEMSTVGP